MSSTINCHVDTTPMARTVGTVSTHVNGTTAAVVAMKGAVIAAEKEGADHVCSKINHGFHSLMQSQISQKTAALQSEVDSLLLKLNHQRKQVTALRQRMERDYQRTCSRYIKIFTTINRSLDQRITEVDRPVISFADGEASKVMNRASLLTADVPVGQSESVRTSQVVGASKLKNQAVKALNAINSFISDSVALDNVTHRILLNRRLPEQTVMASWNVPVMVVETNFDASDVSRSEFYTSRVNLPQESARRIELAVDSAVRSEQLPWRNQPCNDPEVVSQFRAMVAQSGLAPRTQEMMLRMFEANTYQTL